MRSSLLFFILLFVCVTPAAAGPPFPDLIPGYTQELYAVYPGLLYGVAFAPDGDPISIVSTGFAGGSVGLARFDAQTTVLYHGQVMHPLAGTLPVPNNAVGGLVAHPDGSLYLATAQGTVHVDGSSGAVLAGPTGSQIWQLAVDPTNPNRLVGPYYGTLIEVDAGTLAGTPHVLWSGTQSALLDVAFDASGSPLAVAYESLAPPFPPAPNPYRIELVDPVNQALGITASLPSVPHHVALFDGLSNVVTQLYQGGLMRADMSAQAPGNTPATPFATSEFQGNGLRVGPDDCLYVVQYGTRYENGDVTNESSIVRVCPLGVATREATWGKLKAAYR